MPNYRRSLNEGSVFFFTVVTFKRRPFLIQPESREALRKGIETARKNGPFSIDAWVLLPDHLHCIWTLPEGDTDFPRRWNVIKATYSRIMKRQLHDTAKRTLSRHKRRELTIWQRRYWEHRIRDADDFQRHMDYIHFNPVKHGVVASVRDWPYSTFHRHVAEGMYGKNWGGCDITNDSGFGE